MTEIDLRRSVVSAAQSWLGLKESDNSFRAIIDEYNTISPLPNGYRMKYTDPWCAAFVSAVAQRCGLTKYFFPNASCPRMIELYQKAGRWEEDDNFLPQIGDLVFYDWDDSGVGDNKGVSDHVGIVSAVFSGSFNVVEGNYSDSVKQRTMSRNGKFIRGFGRPDYASAAGASKPVETPVQGPAPQPSVPVDSDPILRKGDKSDAVKKMQEMLISSGYDLPKYGADGMFGDETWLAVIRYQRAYHLQVDGIVGPETWESLKKTSASAEVPVQDSGWTPSIGEVVIFNGNRHYIGATSNIGYSCRGGKAKITAIYLPGRAKHPYHLVNLGGGCTVYGWVDSGTFKKA